ALSVTLLFSGCVAAIGNGGGGSRGTNTLGQQLVDLKKAKDTGALTDAEYEAQKTKLLQNK
ncbi:MAG TPA: SHOCT domain-containing protein, partial [Candidatus Sulfotelmatobacter sp.]|nr:SHOCT domain-containing protein [Candidatus Sulfotelmatobacter sp.]